MIRILMLAMLCALLLTPAFAQGGCVACGTAAGVAAEGGVAAVAPTAIAPMVTEPPLRGIVTIIATDGQFYINLGQQDQLRPCAQLFILRDRRVIATAQVIKVNVLDSIAQLAPENLGVRLAPGDTVVVQFNPLPAKIRTRLPDIEPASGDVEHENLIILVTLYAIAAALIN